MAAALALLVILPVLAADGQINKGTGSAESPRFNVSVFDSVNEIEAQAGGVGNATDTVDAGDATFFDITAFDPQDTKVLTTLYVSNDAAAFETVLVTYIKAGLGAGTVTADVKNVNSSESITLNLFVGDDDTERQGAFTVIKGGTTGGTIIAADHGDIIEVKSPDNSITKLTVDGEGPDVGSTGPADEATQTSTEITFTGTITDADAGMRSDAEPADENATADGDTDGLDTQEPVAGAGGNSLDILINVGTDEAGAGGADESDEATVGWTVVTDGFSFSFTQTGFDAGDTNWEIVATDRVGNTTTTDADDEDARDAFKVVIDNVKPTFRSAETGTGWDPAAGDDGASESSEAGIWLVFENDDIGALDDKIDSSSVQIGDFILSDGIVIDEVYVDSNNVYLNLTADLPGDAEPSVQMLAGVISDDAGNSNNTLSIDVDDKIAPTFTVTITGDTASRPIAKTELTVRVDSSEPLTSAPTIYFVDFEATPNVDDIVIKGETSDTMSAVTGSDTAWQESYEDGDMGVSASGLIGFIVLGTDENANDGVTDGGATAGVAPSTGDALDIEKMNSSGLLAELDAAPPEVTETLLPGANDETESTNPFIRLAFDDTDEYGVSGADSGGFKIDQDNDDEDKVTTDSHTTVTITAITLDGDDILGAVARIDDETFNVATAGLSLGAHELKYTAEDAVGNDKDFTYDFDVIDRSDYKVGMSPGWNLISLPGTPVDSDLDSVLPDSMKASRILSWVNGAFEVNERGSDGTWDASGGVTEMVAGSGYWIFTTAFEDIEALIPLPDPSNILPTVAVVGGWNLLGVIDLDQAGDGTGVGNPNTYMASIEFSVVYSYDTQGNSWYRLTNGGTCAAPDSPPALADCMSTGTGYWVWVNKAGTLVP